MLYNDVSHYEDQPEAPKSALSKWWDVGKAPEQGVK